MSGISHLNHPYVRARCRAFFVSTSHVRIMANFSLARGVCRFFQLSHLNVAKVPLIALLEAIKIE